MTNEIDDLSLVLSKDSHGNRIKVSLESFLMFNSDLDHDLLALVDRWSDYMTVESIRASDPQRSSA